MREGFWEFSDLFVPQVVLADYPISFFSFFLSVDLPLSVYLFFFHALLRC